MFDVAPSELIVLGTVALLVIPPKDLPKAMRVAGYWVGRARSVARQFRAGFDDMLRDVELKEMEARWKAENDRIMREHPMPQMLPLDGPHEPGAPEEPGAHEPGIHEPGTDRDAPVVMVEKPVVAEHMVAGPVETPAPAATHEPVVAGPAKPAADPAS